MNGEQRRTEYAGPATAAAAVAAAATAATAGASTTSTTATTASTAVRLRTRTRPNVVEQQRKRTSGAVRAAERAIRPSSAVPTLAAAVADSAVCVCARVYTTRGREREKETEGEGEFAPRGGEGRRDRKSARKRRGTRKRRNAKSDGEVGGVVRENTVRTRACPVEQVPLVGGFTQRREYVRTYVRTHVRTHDVSAWLGS